MRHHFCSFICLLLLASGGAVADEAAYRQLASFSDPFGNICSAWRADIGGETHYLLKIKSSDSGMEATVVLSPEEWEKTEQAVERAVTERRRLKKGEFRLLETVRPEAVQTVAVNLTGSNTITILQVLEKDNDPGIVLDRSTLREFKKLVTKVERERRKGN